MNRPTYSLSLRRVLALVLTLVMTASLFTGCSFLNKPEETEPTPSETIAETAEPTAEPTEEPTAEPTEEPTEPEVTVPAVVMGTVNVDNLNVRSAPENKPDNILKRLAINSRVEILERKVIDDLEWGRIADGWINMNYVTLDDENGNNPTNKVENENNIDKGTGSTGTGSTGTGSTGTGSTGTGSTGTGTGSTGTGSTGSSLVSNGKTTALGYGLVSGVKSLNVRYGPGTNYGEITYVVAGQYLAYFQKSGNWARTRYGWVSMNYFDINADVIGAYGTTTTDLNIREKASSSSKKLGSYEKGEEVYIQDVNGNWGETDEGWISLSYVLFDVDTTTTDTPESTDPGYITGNGVVISEGLNIRETPSASAKIVGTLKGGEEVEILEISGKWGKIEYKTGKYGWINVGYVSIFATGEGTTTAKTLKVRSGPGEDYDRIASLSKGKKVTILEVDGSWGKIQLNTGEYGWISLKYVTMTKINITRYKVTVASTSNGAIKPDYTSCAQGVTVTLTATPSTGYMLDTLTVKSGSTDVTVSGTGNVRTFLMPAGDVTVTATFKVIPPTTYKITVNAATNGAVTSDKTTAAAGETVTLTVTPASGYELNTLKVNNGDVTVTEVSTNKYTFTMPAKAVTVAATFKAEVVAPTLYTVTIKSVTNGTVTADKMSAEAGQTVTLTVAAADGYELDSLKVNNGAVAVTDAGSGKYTFTMPAGHVEVTATFKAVVTRTITVTVVDAGGNPVAGAKIYIGRISGGVVRVTENKTSDANGKITFTNAELLALAQNTKLVAEVDSDACNFEYNLPGTVRTSTTSTSGTLSATMEGGQGYLTILGDLTTSFTGSFVVTVRAKS